MLGSKIVVNPSDTLEGDGMPTEREPPHAASDDEKIVETGEHYIEIEISSTSARDDPKHEESTCEIAKELSSEEAEVTCVDDISKLYTTKQLQQRLSDAGLN